MAKREIIDVRVSRRVLWVGGEAYPLHNIARAAAVRIVPDRAGAVGRFLRNVLLVVLLGIIAGVALDSSPSSPVSELGSLESLGFVAAVLCAAFTVQLLSVLCRRTYYALVVETAGAPFTALTSRDPEVVSRLVHRIMDAIDNPEAEFHVKVENYHLGDKINMVGGERNIGKVGR
ncbi:DUF6232 family protein [Streptomyces neyagawaensis]|uniref:DUF6232 family protein n=1 Tax=Streptomyces neyagawaensis TaxID=42238 RepID=A0ABV3B1A6_9ACTN